LPDLYIYKNLARLNELPDDEAREAFLDCCGSHEWAPRMTEARPFPMIEDLYQHAARIWFALPVADHLEAFAAHPKIGSTKKAATQTAKAGDLSKAEQSGVAAATGNVLADLAEANRLYQEKFGFIFIVCASGKSAEEMLAVARARLGNSVETELQIAAEEQAKITELRLNKLLEK
jgi:OHCU decarboxylase